MKTNERQSIEQECRSLVIKLAQHGDHGEDKDATNLFTEDGVWVRGGKHYRGQAAILASYSTRHGPGTVVRHGVLGTNVTVVDEDAAKAISYYVAFRYDLQSADVKLPAPLQVPFSMGEWHDSFRRTPVGWRVTHRETKRVFERPSEPSA